VLTCFFTMYYSFFNFNIKPSCHLANTTIQQVILTITICGTWENRCHFESIEIRDKRDTENFFNLHSICLNKAIVIAIECRLRRNFTIPSDSIRGHRELLFSVKAGCIYDSANIHSLVAAYVVIRVSAAAREKERKDFSFARKHAADESN